MNPATQQTLDVLGSKLGHAALVTLIRLCPEIRTASLAQQDAACAAMRAKSKEALDELLTDAQGAPWLAEAAFASAVLTLATAGVKVLRGT